MEALLCRQAPTGFVREFYKMCGIVVLTQPREQGPASRDLAGIMIEDLKHRGPDGTRVWSSPDQTTVFAHARLSIIDLEAGWQPMTDPESGSAICCNGEIYNYRELRKELEAEGFSFQTHSDTEVALKAYLKWGTDSFRRLDGMFALAIYDSVQRSLVLARDPVGIKPLYYSVSNQQLRAASELRTLAKFSATEPELDSVGLAHYLSMGYVLAPRTLLSGIQQLMPGFFGIWESGRFETQSFFDLAEIANRKAGARLSVRDCDETLRHLIEKSVESQLVADVPIGTFLSGGIDSSLVTTIASKRAEVPFSSFTVDFDVPGYSEVVQAQRTARALKLRHEILSVDPAELTRAWEDRAWMTDAPIFDNSFLPTYALCRETRKHVKVALSGDGGDEFFLGYETHRADYLRKRIPSPVNRILNVPLAGLGHVIPDRFGKVSLSYKIKAFSRNFAREAAEAHCGWREIAAPHVIQSILQDPARQDFVDHHPSHEFRKIYERVPEADFLTRMSYLDSQTWLTNDILIKADRASMAHGLEVRVPLLSLELIEFTLGLPDRLKFRFRSPKLLLKKALASQLPSYPLKAKKKGFNAPMSEWLNGPLHGALQTLKNLSPPLAPCFRAENLGRLIQEHRSQRRDHGHLLWALIVANAWFGRLQRDRGEQRRIAV